MLQKRRPRNKPLYKKFIRLRENVQYRRKLVKFKKRKWRPLLIYLKRLSKRRKKNFRTYDLNKYLLRKFNNNYKNRFRYNTILKKRFKLFYGGLLEKQIKTIVKKVLNKQNNIIKQLTSRNYLFLEFLEKRLDLILYRAHFAHSVYTARQFISHGHITVNGKIERNHSFLLKQGDIIKINKKAQPLIWENVARSHIWPLPPKYINVNYKTLEIIFNGDIKNYNLSPYYTFWLDINSLIKVYRK